MKGCETIDPNSILFSLPTISDDLPALEPIEGAPNNSDLIFHEDGWSQIEFFRHDQIEEIQRTFHEYKLFEGSHREGSAWRKIYVRQVQRKPLLSGVQPLQQLENMLEVEPGMAPLLHTSSTISGRVKDGFSFGLTGNISLYGYVTPQGIPVLGAILGDNADQSELTRVFAKLHSSHGLILVDWQSQLMLVTVSDSQQIEIWKP
jgi:hypothetical protein